MSDTLIPVKEGSSEWLYQQYDTCLAAGDEEKAKLYSWLLWGAEYWERSRAALEVLATDTKGLLEHILLVGDPRYDQKRIENVLELATGLLDGTPSQPRLTHMEFDEEKRPSFTAGFNYWAIRLLAQNLGDSLRKSEDVAEKDQYWNYKSVTVTHPTAGELSVIVQRDHANTPLRKLAAAEVKIAGLEAQLATALRALEAVESRESPHEDA